MGGVWVVERHIFVVKKLTAVGLESEGNITCVFRKGLLHTTMLYSVVKTVPCAHFKHFFVNCSTGRGGLEMLLSVRF